MKIAVASLGDPRSMSTWSGIPAHIIDALLQKGHKVIPVALSSPKEPWYYNWLRRIYYRAQKKWFLAAVEERILRSIGKQFDEAVEVANPDIVLVVLGDLLAYTSFPQPACIIHDATFAALVDYYPAFSGLTGRSVRQGHKMYANALTNSEAAVFSSAWASESALRDYGVHPSKVHTVPLGANLTQSPPIEKVNEWIAERSVQEECQLLFLGIDWERKGGPDSLRFVAELNRRGVKSKLTIVGCDPIIPGAFRQLVEVKGFLRKDDPSDAKHLESLLTKSTALLLPSQAECYGCVYCEANAYGLPALGRDTGGIPEIIKTGVNGFLLEKGESPENFAGRWIEVWENRALYTSLASTSRKEFEERLNYNIFVERLEEIVTPLLQHEAKTYV